MQRPDYAYLMEMANEDEEVILEILELVQREVPSYLQKAKRALEKDDKPALAESAHFLKRTLSYVGVQQLESMALEIRDYAEGSSNTSKEKAEDLITDLERKFTGLEDELERAKRELIR